MQDTMMDQCGGRGSLMLRQRRQHALPMPNHRRHLTRPLVDTRTATLPLLRKTSEENDDRNEARVHLKRSQKMKRRVIEGFSKFTKMVTRASQRFKTWMKSFKKTSQ